MIYCLLLTIFTHTSFDHNSIFIKKFSSPQDSLDMVFTSIIIFDQYTQSNVYKLFGLLNNCYLFNKN